MSQSLTSPPSIAPPAIVLPSGETATVPTASLCPLKVATSWEETTTSGTYTATSTVAGATLPIFQASNDRAMRAFPLPTSSGTCTRSSRQLPQQRFLSVYFAVTGLESCAFGGKLNSATG